MSNDLEGLFPLGYWGDPEKTAKTFVEIDGVRVNAETATHYMMSRVAALLPEQAAHDDRFRSVLAGGVAAVAAKMKLAPKKDPWAVPTGDPYKAPTTGRDASVTTGIAATGVAPAAETADARYSRRTRRT